MSNSSQEIKAFISYAHKDGDEAMSLIDLIVDHSNDSDYTWNLWNDQNILPSEDWDETIKQQINQSDLAFLFISTAFLKSKYIKDVELQNFLLKKESEGFSIFPILLKNCRYEKYKAISNLHFFKLSEENKLIPFNQIEPNKKDDYAMDIIAKADLLLAKNLEKWNQVKTELVQKTGIHPFAAASNKPSYNEADRFAIDNELSKWIKNEEETILNALSQAVLQKQNKYQIRLTQKELIDILQPVVSSIIYPFIYSLAINQSMAKEYFESENLSLPKKFNQEINLALKHFLHMELKPISPIAKQHLHVSIKILIDIFEG